MKFIKGGIMAFGGELALIVFLLWIPAFIAIGLGILYFTGGLLWPWWSMLLPFTPLALCIIALLIYEIVRCTYNKFKK